MSLEKCGLIDSRANLVRINLFLFFMVCLIHDLVKFVRVLDESWSILMLIIFELVMWLGII